MIADDELPITKSLYLIILLKFSKPNELIIKILNFDLKIKFNNNSKFDGVKRKVLSTKLANSYGWRHKIKFDKAIIETYKDLEKNYKKLRNV